MSRSGDKSIFENRYSRKTINRIENSKKKTDFACQYRIFYIKNTECAKRSFTTYTEFQVGFKLISKTVPAIQLFLKNRLFSSFKLIGVAFSDGTTYIQIIQLYLINGIFHYLNRTAAKVDSVFFSGLPTIDTHFSNNSSKLKGVSSFVCFMKQPPEYYSTKSSLISQVFSILQNQPECCRLVMDKSRKFVFSFFH